MARRAPSTRDYRDPFDPLSGPVSHILDLHQHTAQRARELTLTFLRDSQKRSPGCLVHIITGKGRNSRGAPVLKPLIRKLLSSSVSPHVRDWSQDDDEGGYLVRLLDRGR